MLPLGKCFSPLSIGKILDEAHLNTLHAEKRVLNWQSRINFMLPTGRPEDPPEVPEEGGGWRLRAPVRGEGAHLRHARQLLRGLQGLREREAHGHARRPRGIDVRGAGKLELAF